MMVLGLCLLVAQTAQAQQTGTGPAEVPPASFQGTQYVDSKGCIYIRAGVPGNVSWVPRVTRDGASICGYQPSIQTTTGSKTPPQKVVVIGAPGAPENEQVVLEQDGFVLVSQAEARPGALSPTARVLPKHLHERRKSLPPLNIPKGYRTAWEDERLNPRRAEQTLSGHAAMQENWTNTVPMRARQER